VSLLEDGIHNSRPDPKDPKEGALVDAGGEGALGEGEVDAVDAGAFGSVLAGVFF
jgi:hypothetical protein